MKFLYKILLVWICLIPNTVVAIDSKWGMVAMYVDETKTINMSKTFVDILNQETVHLISYEWTSSDNNIAQIGESSLYSCTVKGIRIGGARINCHLFYKMDGVLTDTYHTIDGYIELVVIESNPENWYNEPESPTDNWQKSENIDFSWYNKNKTEFTLATNKELAGMAYLVNNGYTEFEGKRINISEDIDLSGKRWVSCKSFKGTFDGQGHTISGIYVGTESEDQKDFGFWQTINKATITDVVMVGIANYAHTKISVINTAAGGLVGTMTNSTISKCKVGIDVYFKRGACSAWSATRALEGSYIGGLVGTMESGKGTIKYCTYSGSIKCLLPENLGPQAIYIGGIIGSASSNLSIEYCEVLTPSIQMMDYGQSSMYRNICGIGDWTEPKFCRSIINNIDIYNRNNPSVNVNEVVYRVSGISSYYVATNCYSVISSIDLSSKQPKTNFYMSNISYSPSNNAPIACFSNSDISINSNVPIQKSYGSGNGSRTCFDGSTSFSSEQMRTDDFLTALNVYSTLEMDGPIWGLNNQEFPVIKDLYETTGIFSPQKVLSDDKRIYNLNGTLLKSPQKGINIIGGRKVIVK